MEGEEVDAPAMVGVYENSQEFRKALQEWVDMDYAAYLLAHDMGMYPEPRQSFIEMKWIFWSNNPVGNMVYAMLKGMMILGLLEYDEEELRYRWVQENDTGE